MVGRDASTRFRNYMFNTPASYFIALFTPWFLKGKRLKSGSNFWRFEKIIAKEIKLKES
jgi:hypothetical protein